MLVIVSKDSSYAVLKALGAVVSRHPDFQVKVIDGNTPVPEEATALLMLGPQMLATLQTAGVVPKNRTVTGLRKQVFQFGGIPTIVSYNVGIGEVEYGYFVDLLTDCSMAYTLAKTGSITPKFGENYEFVANLTDVVASAKELIATQGFCDQAFDTETLGLDRFAPDGFIVSLQFTHRPGHAWVLPFPNQDAEKTFMLALEHQEDLAFLLQEKKIRTCAANGKYDIEWVYERSGVECENFNFDTTAVGSLLDENRSNGLDVHAKIYTDMGGYSDEFDKKANKSRMDLELMKDPEAFLLYSGGDTDATLQVKNAQKAELIQDDALTGFYVNILHPALRAFEKVERGGVCVDLEKFKALDADLRVEIDKLIKSAKEQLPGTLVAKHYDASKQGGINLTKASLICDYMFSPKGLGLKPKMVTEKSKDPSTAMEHLEMFTNHPEAGPFVKALSEYSAATKALGTYVGEIGKSGFLKHLKKDGRFHPTYWLFAGNKDEGEGGTNTGRLSVKDPAFQTIPKHTVWGKRLRECFPAPPGFMVLECDYSQGELRVVACVAGETNMIQAYKEGKDLHAVTGGSIGGFSYETMMEYKAMSEDSAEFALYEKLRQQAKAGNFGLLYGMGVEGFMEYARLNYGVVMTYEEAEKVRNLFFATYPGLVSYHETYKTFAKKHGYVRSPLGRVRHLPLIKSPNSQVRSKAERQAINSPIQGALSDMMIWAIAEHYDQGHGLIAPCFGAIHDAGYYYVPEDNAKEYAKIVVDTMQNLPLHKVGWEPELEFIADAKLGKDMTHLSKVKF